MKLVLAILALVVFALSFVADYKWRQWMSRRRDDQDPSTSNLRPPRENR
jgi:hypothetical protein